MKNVLLIFVLLATIALDFLTAAGATGIVCKCFGLFFTWKIALGVWVIVLFIHNFIIRTHK